MTDNVVCRNVVLSHQLLCQPYEVVHNFWFEIPVSIRSHNPLAIDFGRACFNSDGVRVTAFWVFILVCTTVPCDVLVADTAIDCIAFIKRIMGRCLNARCLEILRDTLRRSECTEIMDNDVLRGHVA